MKSKKRAFGLSSIWFLGDQMSLRTTFNPSNLETIVAALLGFGFTFAFGEASLPVNQQTAHLPIGSLRQVAA